MADDFFDGISSETVKSSSSGSSVDSEGTTWDKTDIDVASTVPLIDPGIGGGQIVRRYEVVLPPMKGTKPQMKEILHHHYKYIENQLYADGWEMTAPPKISKVSKTGLKYYIFISAKPGFKGGMQQQLTDNPRLLQDITKGMGK